MAELYRSLERYKEAEPLQLRALKICEEQLGATHPNTAASLNNLASLYRSLGRYEEAIPFLEKWQSIKHERRETQSQLFAERIRTLGKLYEECQRFPEAVDAYEEASSLFERLLGAKNPRVFVIRGELARLKKRINRELKRHK